MDSAFDVNWCSISPISPAEVEVTAFFQTLFPYSNTGTSLRIVTCSDASTGQRCVALLRKIHIVFYGTIWLGT